MAEDNETSPSNELAVVEVADGLVCVFGDTNCLDIELTEPPLLPASASKELISSAMSASGIVNLATQSASKVLDSSMAGRLFLIDPISAQKLAAGGHHLMRDKGGAMLGALQQNGSNLVASQARWISAENLVSGAATASNLAMAVALASIQSKLSDIEKCVSDAKKVSLSVLEELRIDSWAEMEALQEQILKTIAEANHIGAVIDDLWDNVSGYGLTASKLQKQFASKVEKHLQQIRQASSNEELRKYLDDNQIAILRDVRSLMLAQNTAFTYEALRAGHLYQAKNTGEAEAKLIEKIIADAKACYAQHLQKSSDLLRELNLRFSVLAELPAKWQIPFLSSGQDAAQLRATSSWMLEQLRPLAEQSNIADRPTPEPKLVIRQSLAKSAGKILRWVMLDGEELLTITPARKEGQILPGDLILAITNQRVIISDSSKFQSSGEIETTIPLSEIRYVRHFTDPSSKTTKLHLDIIATTQNYAVVINNLDEKTLPIAEKIAQTLAAHMRLPQAEIPELPTELSCPETETKEIIN